MNQKFSLSSLIYLAINILRIYIRLEMRELTLKLIPFSIRYNKKLYGKRYGLSELMPLLTGIPTLAHFKSRIYNWY